MPRREHGPAHRRSRRLLDPVDDRPPVSVMTRVGPIGDGRLVIQGMTADDGTVRAVQVNGRAARSLAPNYSRWEVELDGLVPGPLSLAAAAQDDAGNLEPNPHRTSIVVP